MGNGKAILFQQTNNFHDATSFLRNQQLPNDCPNDTQIGMQEMMLRKICKKEKVNILLHNISNKPIVLKNLKMEGGGTGL